MEISTFQDFDLAATVRSHGWMNLAPFSWSEQSGTLNWSIQFDGTVVPVEVTQNAPRKIDARISMVTASRIRAEVCSTVRRVLMLDWDPTEAITIARSLDINVASLFAKGAGRFLRGTTAFEDAVKTVCTINTSWSNSVNMVRHLVFEYGNGAFPTPEHLARISAERLRAKARVGYRADIILHLARLEVSGRRLDQFSREQLLSIKGLGPYSVDHMMMLRGDYSRIPVDSEVTKYCVEVLGLNVDDDAEAIQRHFSEWGSYRFLGYKFGRIARSNNWIGDPD